VRDLLTSETEQAALATGTAQRGTLKPDAVRVDAVISTIGFPLVRDSYAPNSLYALNSLICIDSHMLQSKQGTPPRHSASMFMTLRSSFPCRHFAELSTAALELVAACLPRFHIHSLSDSLIVCLAPPFRLEALPAAWRAGARRMLPRVS
jgi:hypothetical protein